MPSQNENIGVQVKMWTQNEITDYYSKYAKNYDREVDEDHSMYPAPFLLGQWAIEHIIREKQVLMKKHDLNLNGVQSIDKIVQINEPTHIKILDLGCGTGQSCVPFLQHSKISPNYKYELVGMDATTEMLEKANDRQIFSKLIKHDLENYPYPPELQENFFDMIMCVGVMEFIQNPLKFMSFVKKYLKNYAFSEHHTTSIQPVLCITLPERHDYSELSTFTRKEMENLIEKAGFQIERHQRFMGYEDRTNGKVQYYHGWLLSVQI